MVYSDLMHWYKLCSDLTTGKDKYYSYSEYCSLMPFERDIFMDMIIERNSQGATKVPDDDVITDFEEF